MNIINEDEYLSIILGKDYNDYNSAEKIKKWKTIFNKLQTGTHITWSWGAFLFGPFWLAYRRLYIVLSVFIALEILYIVLPNFLVSFLCILSRVFLALYGNKICLITYEKYKIKNPSKPLPYGGNVKLIFVPLLLLYLGPTIIPILYVFLSFLIFN